MIDETRVFSKQLAYGLIAVGLLLSAMIFIQLASGSYPDHYSQFAVYFAYFTTALVNPLFMILGTQKSWAKLPAIVIFHFTMAIMLVFFSEIYSPFTPLWSMLTLFASIYYGWYGFIGSSATLFATATAYALLFADDLRPNFVVYAVLAGLVSIMTIFTAYLFVRIIMSSRKKNHDLEKSQQSEFLQVNRLNTLLNSISDAVLTLNRYGRVTSQNAAAQALFDTNESLIGRDIDKMFTLSDSNDKLVSARNLIDEVKSSSLRDDLSVGSGPDKRHLSIQMSRIRSTFGDNEEYGVVLIIRDITKQKTLEDEKDEFISVTSHELRTPVAIAEGSLSNLLLMQERGVPEQKLTEAAETAHKQIIYLAQMINDLSTLSRAERGVGDNLESIDINEMLYNLFSKYTPQAEEKSLKLDLDAEPNLPRIETSKLYLEEMLQNFITNAIKYTKEGTITFGAKTESQGYVRFFVKDTGIGISKPDVQHIFDKFYRSEDYRTRETSGTGLGLYVVAKLAGKLGIKIKVDSRLNMGSTFSFVMAQQSTKFKKSQKDSEKTVEQVESEHPVAVSS
jgi:two-component system phosphate regulon sensor histidine kinase PhoR